jgi:cell division protease FtsH
MVTRYGMDPRLGHVSYESDPRGFLHAPQPQMGPERRYSEETAREIDCGVREIVSSAFERAVGLLKDRRDDLERGAKALLEKETLNEQDLQGFARPQSAIAAASPLPVR